MSAAANRILCPVDHSESSLKALRYAERLARDAGAEIVLAHAFDLPEKYTADAQQIPADPQVRAWLDALPVATGLAVRRALHAGPPGEVICWLAQQEQADLIVMGTHGRTGLKHLLLGSVAEYVLRHAPCPVLVLREHRVGEAPVREPQVAPPNAPPLM